MPYDVSWYNPQKVVFLKSVGTISEADAAAADIQIQEFLSRSREDRVHIFIDDGEAGSLPGISVTTALATLKHPKMGWTVVVGQKDKVYRMMYTITCHLRGRPLYFADTLEEAARFIEKVVERQG